MQGTGGDRADCMRQFRTAWDRLAADRARQRGPDQGQGGRCSHGQAAEADAAPATRGDRTARRGRGIDGYRSHVWRVAHYDRPTLTIRPAPPARSRRGAVQPGGAANETDHRYLLEE
jgi:hypothetical protein